MDFGGIGITEIMQFLPKIQENAEKVKVFLPQLLEWEKSILTDEEKAKGGKVVYMAIVLNNKVWLMASVLVNNKETNEDVLVRTHGKIELFDLIENPMDLLSKIM